MDTAEELLAIVPNHFLVGELPELWTTFAVKGACFTVSSLSTWASHSGKLRDAIVLLACAAKSSSCNKGLDMHTKGKKTLTG